MRQASDETPQVLVMVLGIWSTHREGRGMLSVESQGLGGGRGGREGGRERGLRCLQTKARTTMTEAGMLYCLLTQSLCGLINCFVAVLRKTRRLSSPTSPMFLFLPTYGTFCKPAMVKQSFGPKKGLNRKDSVAKHVKASPAAGVPSFWGWSGGGAFDTQGEGGTAPPS